MRDPLSKTFHVLSASASKHAHQLMMHALKQSDERVQTRALETMLNRGYTGDIVEIIRIYPDLKKNQHSVIARHGNDMSNPLRQSLLHGNDELVANSLSMIRNLEIYAVFPTLLEMTTRIDHGHREEIFETIRTLINRLYDHCQSGKGKHSANTYLRNAPEIKHEVLTHLDRIMANYENIQKPSDIIEAILILGDVDSFACKKVLMQASRECRDLAGQLLMTSAHPGVMQLVLDSLAKNYPHAKAFAAIRERNDLEFICYLLEWFPAKLTHLQSKNLKQIDDICWLDPYSDMLKLIPPNLQSNLVRFLLSTGLPYNSKLSIQEWLARNGSAQGRQAASEVFSDIKSSAVQHIVLDALHNEDPEVEAWATGELRARGIPAAFSLLVERLDSPQPEVASAARKQLEGFNLQRMLGIIEYLSPRICHRVGELIKKIEPDSVKKLKRELMKPIQKRRIQALRAARALNWHLEILDQINILIHDEDSLIRRICAEIMAGVDHPTCQEALEHLLLDESPRVREAARKSLQATENLLSTQLQ